jgi:hypothetical protein
MALACAGLALLPAPEAEASETSYLQSLNNYGLSVYDTTAALSTGYTICSMLDYATGDKVALYVFANTSWSDVPDIETAATLVLVSVEELCPRHDHRGGYVT